MPRQPAGGHGLPRGVVRDQHTFHQVPRRWQAPAASQQPGEGALARSRTTAALSTLNSLLTAKNAAGQPAGADEAAVCSAVPDPASSLACAVAAGGPSHDDGVAGRGHDGALTHVHVHVHAALEEQEQGPHADVALGSGSISSSTTAPWDSLPVDLVTRITGALPAEAAQVSAVMGCLHGLSGQGHSSSSWALSACPTTSPGIRVWHVLSPSVQQQCCPVFAAATGMHAWPNVSLVKPQPPKPY